MIGGTVNDSRRSGSKGEYPHMKKRQAAPVGIRNRFAAIYGEEKLAEKVAELTGANRATVFRWFESGCPDAIVLILEFLEKTPREYWPQHARNIGYLAKM